MGFLNDKKNVISIGIVLIIFSIFIWFILSYLIINENFYLRMLENRKKETYSGIVFKKYIDKSEHSTPMLKLTDTLISLENTFWENVSEGDSIVKIKGSSIITLYRKDGSIITFDYNNYFQKLIDKKRKNEK